MLNAFVEAASLSFMEHYPLILSPDDIWLCIAQGFGQHVNLHAEELRGRLVRHQGKHEIEIRRDDFIKGSPANDWPMCFPELSDRIAEQIGKTRDLIVADFSTTGAVEKAASEVVLMSAMQSYYDYSVHTLCGIPTITLLGTTDDWRSVRLRAATLAEFGLDKWVTNLLPVLDQFVAASRGQVDRAFWQSFYKLEDESGGPRVTGWINVLFPYLTSDELDEPAAQGGELVWNRAVEAWASGMRDGSPEGSGDCTEDEDEDEDEEWLQAPDPGQFPLGLSTAPFLWKFEDRHFPMEFLGGFVGISQDSDTRAIRPAIGWAVREVKRDE